MGATRVAAGGAGVDGELLGLDSPELITTVSPNSGRGSCDIANRRFAGDRFDEGRLNEERLEELRPRAPRLRGPRVPRSEAREVGLREKDVGGCWDESRSKFMLLGPEGTPAAWEGCRRF